MNCGYFINQGCQLGLFGGKPHAGNCRECVKSGENNPEYAAKLFAAREISHPSSAPKVSGCCDSAENPVVKGD